MYLAAPFFQEVNALLENFDEDARDRRFVLDHSMYDWTYLLQGCQGNTDDTYYTCLGHTLRWFVELHIHYRTISLLARRCCDAFTPTEPNGA